jgi:hypothetical protein
MARKSGGARIGYSLLDAEARAKKNPDTFKIPSERMRLGLMAMADGGKVVFVKVIFMPLDSNDGEGMWLRLAGWRGGRAGDGGRYVGVLDNLPVNPAFGLKEGDEVLFSARHVIDVDTGKDGDGEGLIQRIARAARSW